MEGRWLREARNGCAVVFVHGILSDAEKCWKSKSGTYWPKLFSEEQEETLRDFGIYLFGYKTGIFVDNYSLNDAVDAFAHQLQIDDVIGESRKLVFVCHSMGGLIARKYLVNQQIKLLELNVSVGLFLVASPSLGSKYANIISRFFRHTQVELLVSSERNYWLKDLDNSFHTLKESKYEVLLLGKELIEDIPPSRLKLLGAKNVVSPFSAAKYFNGSIKIPNSDHSSICKPESSSSLQHRLLVNFTHEFLKKRKKIQLINLVGKKYHVEEGNEWWISLAKNATGTFFLIGQTNKSWFTTNDEEKKILAKAFARIANSRGRIRVVSKNLPHVIAFTKNFMLNYLAPLLENEAKENVGYSVVEHINYNAVVSDNRLVLMPRMNSTEFRDKSMVLVVEKERNKDIFQEYLTDIEIAAFQESSQIDW